MLFQASDSKGKNFLELLDNDLNHQVSKKVYSYNTLVIQTHCMLIPLEPSWIMLQ